MLEGDAAVLDAKNANAFLKRLRNHHLSGYDVEPDEINAVRRRCQIIIAAGQPDLAHARQRVVGLAVVAQACDMELARTGLQSRVTQGSSLPPWRSTATSNNSISGPLLVDPSSVAAVSTRFSLSMVASMIVLLNDPLTWQASTKVLAVVSAHDTEMKRPQLRVQGTDLSRNVARTMRTPDAPHIQGQMGAVG